MKRSWRPALAPAPEQPSWLLTYSDLMSLLLCFFIMLVALAGPPNSDPLRSGAESVEGAFRRAGLQLDPAVQAFPPAQPVAAADPLPSRVIDDPKAQQTVANDANPGAPWTAQTAQPACTLAFDGELADLTAEHRSEIELLARDLVASRALVEVVGISPPLRSDSRAPFRDHLDLGYVRARRTLQLLVALGVDASRCRLVQAGWDCPGLPRIQPSSTVPQGGVVVMVHPAAVSTVGAHGGPALRR